MNTVPPPQPTQPPPAPAAPGQVPPPGTLPKLPQTIFNLEKRGEEAKPGGNRPDTRGRIAGQ